MFFAQAPAERSELITGPEFAQFGAQNIAIARVPLAGLGRMPVFEGQIRHFRAHPGIEPGMMEIGCRGQVVENLHDRYFLGLDHLRRLDERMDRSISQSHFDFGAFPMDGGV